jgi:hypothetical protein
MVEGNGASPGPLFVVRHRGCRRLHADWAHRDRPRNEVAKFMMLEAEEVLEAEGDAGHLVQLLGCERRERLS